ncbi:hypothetical protein PVAP13_4KG141300 [Panicum virgatum]|uniref:C2H2-type domain-containing protein n=1 Tax=Panicum virgatum TaxID=38727 RepID=A0A8T0TK37_PANVG|nr:hypothetical protein PVAP13_4KG141300 [Panicum virgatum]
MEHHHTCITSETHTIQIRKMMRARDDTDVMEPRNDVLHVHRREEGEHQEHGHQSAAFFDDDAFLSLSSSSSCSAAEPAAATAAPPPHNNKRCLRRRRRRQDAFECRTCGRRFATFQALGGHRTSHLRRRPPAATKSHRPKQPVAAHACAACGLGFPTGQALGGHMRRHRRAKCMGSDDVGFTQIIMFDRPRSASLQLLDLFVPLKINKKKTRLVRVEHHHSPE